MPFGRSKRGLPPTIYAAAVRTKRAREMVGRATAALMAEADALEAIAVELERPGAITKAAAAGLLRAAAEHLLAVASLETNAAAGRNWEVLHRIASVAALVQLTGAVLDEVKDDVPPAMIAVAHEHAATANEIHIEIEEEITYVSMNINNAAEDTSEAEAPADGPWETLQQKVDELLSILPVGIRHEVERTVPWPATDGTAFEGPGNRDDVLFSARVLQSQAHYRVRDENPPNHDEIEAVLRELDDLFAQLGTTPMPTRALDQ